jgi:broad specificity phosphatase PhoE
MSPSSLPNVTPPNVAWRATAPAPAAALADLWLVRHGESTWNLAGLQQGHNDEAALTIRGRRQAAAAAARFRGKPVRAIYSSDLRRALQTAGAFSMLLGLPVVADSRLRERSAGVLEGSPRAPFGGEQGCFGLADGRVVDADARPLGGESVRDLYLRAAAFCDDLAADLATDSGRPTDIGPTDVGPTDVGTARDPGQAAFDNQHVSAAAGPACSNGDVLVIAHGGTVRVIEAYLRGVPVEQMTWGPVDNAAIVQIPQFGSHNRESDRHPRGGI